MGYRRLYLRVHGEADGLAAWHPDHQPVKLFEALGSPQTGPAPMPRADEDGLPFQADTLEVIEQLPGGVFRSTLWRLPS